MPLCLLSTPYPKVAVLFNINFTPPSHQTRHIQRKEEHIFIFFLSSFWNGFMSITVLPTMQIYPNMCRFVKCADFCGFLRFFPTFIYEKKTETKWEFILYERVWEVFLEISLHFFKNYPQLIFLQIFSTRAWISSNYQTLLPFFEKPVQNLNKFFVKFTQILFIIQPSFLKIFSMIFKISPNFFRIFL